MHARAHLVVRRRPRSYCRRAAGGEGRGARPSEAKPLKLIGDGAAAPVPPAQIGVAIATRGA